MGAEPEAVTHQRTLLKSALLVSGALVLIIAGAIAYIVATFDPRDYQHHIVQLIKDKTGRTLELSGEVSLSFWPDLAVRLGRASLSERASDEPFANVESARVRLALVPLLSREIVASDLVLTGANVVITRYKDGRLNIDDLIGGEGAVPRFEIGRLALERSAIVYRDLGSGARYELTDISLHADRLANTVETPVTMAFTVHGLGEELIVHTRLRGQLALDLQRGHFALTRAAVDLTGRVPGLINVSSHVAGDAALQSGELRIGSLSATVQGTRAEDELKLAVDAAKFVVVGDHASADDLRLGLLAKGAAGTSNVKLALPSVRREGDRLEAARAGLELAAQRGQHTVRTNASAALEGSIAARTLTAAGLDGTFTVAGPRLPRKGLAGALKGEAAVDLRHEGVRLNLAATLAESAVKAQLTAAGFAAPVYTFVVQVDQLDLDRYLAAMSGTGQATPAGDASLLKVFAEIPATGSITVGLLKSGDVKANNVRFEMK
jgi:AsmA protein